MTYPHVLGHERVPRLRRVPQPGQRDVDALARGARELRRPPRDGRADAAPSSSRSSTPPRPSTRASRRASTSPPPCSTRPGTALAPRRPTGSTTSRRSRRRRSPRWASTTRAVPTRYSSTYFAHTFSGGYDAGYYSYIWSEVLDADTVEWFEENGGLTRENGDRFRARPARRRRVEGPARGLPRLPRPRRRRRAAARAPRPRLTLRIGARSRGAERRDDGVQGVREARGDGRTRPTFSARSSRAGHDRRRRVLEHGRAGHDDPADRRRRRGRRT